MGKNRNTYRDHLSNLGIDGGVIVKRILQETGLEVEDWSYLADVRENYWALMNAVMNLRVP